MDVLPSGRVTLLFSDMEGSTVLLGRLGERYVEALDAHRRILRSAWRSRSGHELGTEGDSFFVVFADPLDAVLAGAAAQQGLAAYAWPDGQQVRVRIGLHTGSPLVHEGGYVGIDVHRAARIAATAHGGQIVLSAATVELVAGQLPTGLDLRDLGEHRLKDLERPERMFQLEVLGLAQSFPPLRSLGAASNLPPRSAELLGRERDLANLSRAVREGGARLLTMTGPGGVGKSALAVELARSLVDEFSGGVYFVPLASIGTVDGMWNAIAEALGLQGGRDEGDVIQSVAARKTLLVLDNLEQINGAGKIVHTLLEAAPQATILATSRRPLHLSVEQECPVPPLGVSGGDDLSAVAAAPATQLFTRVATRVRPSFAVTPDNAADVAETCRRLEGMPLAIELAAARTKLLAPRALLARLGDALDLASPDVDRPSRHHTLRETTSWSYELLQAPQRQVFRRLGVFDGGADLDAVAAVCFEPESPFDPLGVVEDLVDASLVSILEDPRGDPRVVMLESIHAFAAELLMASEESDEIRERHLDHFARVIHTRLDPFAATYDPLRARAILIADEANMSSALDWALTERATDSPDRRVLRLVDELTSVLFSSGRTAQATAWVERAITYGRAVVGGDLAACMAARADFQLQSGQGGPTLAQQAVEIFRIYAPDHRRFPYALRVLALIDLEQHRYTEARATYEEAVRVARAQGDPSRLAYVLAEFSGLLAVEGDVDGSLAMDGEALRHALESDRPETVARCRHNYACSLRASGRLRDAEHEMCALVPMAVALSSPFNLVTVAEDFGAILAELGQDQDAARLLGSADATAAELGMTRREAQANEIGPAYELVRNRLSRDEWARAYTIGGATPIDELLTLIVNDM